LIILNYGEIFIDLAKKCQSLVCSRLSPNQKAQLVEMVRAYEPQKSVLSVGDGANDSSMLIAANVGVAICGVEGR
jgi:phospholipid-transporting ATPase